MAQVPNVIQAAIWLARSLAQSAGVLTNFSTSRYGISLPDPVLQAPPVKALLGSAAGSSNDLAGVATDLENAATSGNTGAIILQFVKLAQKLTSHFSIINNLQGSLQTAVGSIADPGQKAAAQAFVTSLAKRLVDDILITSMEDRGFGLMMVFKIIGLIDWGYTPAIAGNPLSTDFVKRDLRFDRFKDLISDPGTHLKNIIGWGSAGFDPTPFFNLYAEQFPEEAAITIGVNAGNPFLKFGSFVISRDSATNPPGLKMEFTIAVDKGDDIRTPINDSWAVTVAPQLSISGKAGLVISPPMSVKLTPPAGQVSGSFKVFVNRNDAAQPFNIFSGNDLLNITAKDVQMGFGVAAKWDSGSGKATLLPLFFLNLVQGNVKIGSSGADSFIGKLLGSANIESNFDLGLEWSMEHGLKVQASGGIEVQIPLHKQLGPIELNALYIAMNIKPDGVLALETSAGITGNLGPMTATVDRIGLMINTKFTGNTNGKFGPLDVSIAFKPPRSVGLSLDIGVVKGGGFLDFAPEKGEYAGMLELNILNIVSAKAIGLINTKMPDGTNGFSLLIIITAEFTPPFQLSFGFTLIGVGGLLGLNRTVLLDPLREGVRNGAVNSIMFPQNIIANAPRIISDLRAIFPPYVGKFLIGPMAKLGWGTPTLISLSLGVIIEIPGNIAILGVLRLALPTEDLALINIQVNFLGTIDFGQQMLTFDASLYESHILFMTLEGDMAVRLKWGDNANFLISVGGFHPSYTPPPLALGILKRLSVTILNTPTQMIRVECYTAVTSNTAQFGARAELRYGFDSCNINGFLQFDALFQFSPFHFIISISAGLAAEVLGEDLLSINLSFSLEGPGLWRAKGSGSISIPIFPDIDVDFDFTWGDSPNTTLPSIEIMPRLIEEIKKPDQWKAVLPATSNLLVSLRKLSEAESALALHPAGSLVISQRLLPLNFIVDKVGNQPLSDIKEIKITSAQTGGQPMGTVAHMESFARAQYKNMNDADRLSTPSFQLMEGGITVSVGQNNWKIGAAVVRDIEYEVKIIDKDPPPGRLFMKVSGVLLSLFSKGSAVKKSVLSKEYKSQLQPNATKPKLQEEGYYVVNVNNNKAFNDTPAFGGEAMARDFMDRQIAANPGLKKDLQVIPQYELNTL